MEHNQSRGSGCTGFDSIKSQRFSDSGIEGDAGGTIYSLQMDGSVKLPEGLEPGDKVSVEYRVDGEKLILTKIARAKG